jgi:enoyl-CoA hydratase
MGTESHLLSSIDSGVLRLQLNRPGSLNAVTTPLLVELAERISDATPAAGVRAVVLSGSGAAFCSGADLRAEEVVSVAAANDTVRAIRDARVPTIAQVQGAAAGVGCSLALACDFVVMSESAYLLLAFTRIGLMPDGGATALVAASVGRARAMRLAMLAEKLPARTALEWGLVSEVFPDAEVGTGTSDLAARLAAGPIQAFAETKHAINASTLTELEGAFGRELAGQAVLARSDDYREGVAAFMDRRAAQFTGS